jgi:hypothetical protein
MRDDVRVGIYQFFYLIYPWIQIHGMWKPLELNVFGAKVFVEFYVEQF